MTRLPKKMNLIGETFVVVSHKRSGIISQNGVATSVFLG
jgi:hypothetical protein